MKKILLFILLCFPLFLHAQVNEDKDPSDLSLAELAAVMGPETRALKTAEDSKDKAAICRTAGYLGGIYLALAKQIDESEEKNQKATNAIKDKEETNFLNKSMDYCKRSIDVGEEIGDVDHLRKSYKTLSAAQKMSGNLAASMKTLAKMMALKKGKLNANKENELEKKQIEQVHSRREDSMRRQQQIAEEHLKEQARTLAQKQYQLDSANKAISMTEAEKTNVSRALRKTQADLSQEKQTLEEQQTKLTLSEQEKALQATNLQLKESALQLQQNEMQLQKSKMELQQNELKIKDRYLDLQRIFIYIGLGGLLILSGFMFFIVRERKKAVQQKLRAERSEKFKQQFISNISHEIRTPMNAINGMIGLLLQKNPRPEQESYLKGINKSADILLHVINDVLDLSKIEAGKLELESIDFSIAETINQVKETLSYKAEEKGLQLVTRIDENLDDVVVGDPYRLNQILINLGGNALKFTEKGGVHIDLDLVKKEDDHVYIKYSISDTGIGIPADKIANLFENFTQVNSSDTRKYGGTGLGLSISRHLVKMMGGDIAVESTVGSGTTFSFVIKYAIGSAKRLEERIAVEQNVDGGVLSGLRILIADDNEYNLLVVDETLHLLSPTVFTELVVNGQEATEMMGKNDYDLILMDVQMPVMNGLEASKFIRTNLPADKNKVPIIAFTASVLRADIDECFQSGMNAYVPKPFKPWQLINTIAEVTGKERPIGYVQKEYQSNGADSIIAVMNDNGGTSDKVTDMAYLRKFCEDDEKRMKKYIKVYLNALPAFNNNMGNAIAKKDFVEIALHVHSFKPKWMMMGMKQTNELGIKIDHLCKSNSDNVFENLEVLMEHVNKSAKELAELS